MKTALIASSLFLVVLAACRSDDGKAPTPIAVPDRLLTTADVPGFSVAREFHWTDAEGVRDDGLGTTTIQASADDAYNVVRAAGFKEGAARVFELDDGTGPDLVVVIVLQLGSAAGARDVLGFSADDSEKPCPETCAFAVTATKVSDIPGARGVERIASAENVVAAGTADMTPVEVHRIAFTDGPFFYYVSTVTSPPSPSAGSSISQLAKTVYGRVKGAPATSE